MRKLCIRLALVLGLIPMSVAFAIPPGGESCERDTTWTDGNGVPLVCYHCASATYCYYN